MSIILGILIAWAALFLGFWSGYRLGHRDGWWICKRKHCERIYGKDLRP